MEMHNKSFSFTGSYDTFFFFLQDISISISVVLYKYMKYCFKTCY